MSSEKERDRQYGEDALQREMEAGGLPDHDLQPKNVPEAADRTVTRIRHHIAQT